MKIRIRAHRGRMQMGRAAECSQENGEKVSRDDRERKKGFAAQKACGEKSVLRG